MDGCRGEMGVVGGLLGVLQWGSSVLGRREGNLGEGMRDKSGKLG